MNSELGLAGVLEAVKAARDARSLSAEFSPLEFGSTRRGDGLVDLVEGNGGVRVKVDSSKVGLRSSRVQTGVAGMPDLQ